MSNMSNNKEPKIFYLCNRMACENCHNEECHHTSKIEHAINFKKKGEDYWEYISIIDYLRSEERKKWQQLKEFIQEEINFDKNEIAENREIPNLPNKYYLIAENHILDKMQELEGDNG